VRGGFGIFYLPELECGGALGFAADTNYVTNLAGGGINNSIPVNNFASGNPLPASVSPTTNGLLLPTGASLGQNTALWNSVIFANPNHATNLRIWNLIVECTRDAESSPLNGAGNFTSSRGRRYLEKGWRKNPDRSY
jgi:hypothetical protein